LFAISSGGLFMKKTLSAASALFLASTSLLGCQAQPLLGNTAQSLLPSSRLNAQAASPNSRQQNQQNFIEATASQFHETWRAGRRKPDGSFEPRPKETKDPQWIALHGTNQVDIANTAYPALPADWQAENRASAVVAVGAIMAQAGLLNAAFIEQASSLIHDKWLERNSYAKGGELDKPYALLPENEKQKDREVLYQALVKGQELNVVSPQKIEPVVHQAIQAMLKRMNP
jgi:hypothetical protein